MDVLLEDRICNEYELKFQLCLCVHFS